MTEIPPPDDSKAALRVAAGQFAGGDDTSENLAQMEGLATAAAQRGAAVVVFPEAAMYAWSAPKEDLQAAAVQHANGFVRGLSDIAEATDVVIVAGMFAPSGGPRPFNRMVAVDGGGVIASYDKAHLYDAFAYRESDRVMAGPTYPDHTELGILRQGPWVLGLLNCYDLRFPEMARLLVDQGVNVLVVSSAWVAGAHKEMHWDTLLRSRAIENTCYVVAASQPPPTSVGLSMIVDPLGVAAATCTQTEGLAIHDLALTHLARVRDLVPSLRQRRYATGTVNRAQTLEGPEPIPDSIRAHERTS